MERTEPDNFCWIELAAHTGKGMARNQFVNVHDAPAIHAWRSAHHNRDVYASICRFQQPDRDSPYICDLVLDIDGADLQLAKRQTQAICARMIQRWQLDPGYLRIAFSGAKGFHVEVPRVVFNNPAGPLLMGISRHFARRLIKEGFGCVDGGIYQPARVLRLPNSVHSKTALHKIPLEYAELVDLELEYICEHAREPREDDCMAVPADVAPKAVAWLHEVEDWWSRRRATPDKITLSEVSREGWRYPPCVRKAERATLADGNRHEVLLTIARFYAAIGMAQDEMAYRLHEINARNPLRDGDYIERLAADARKYAGFSGCPNEALASFCEPNRCFLCRRRDVGHRAVRVS